MINTLAENKIRDYLKSIEELEDQNIVVGISDDKRDLPCIVVHCDAATDYPNTPPTAGLFVLSIKIMVLQSNTETILAFKDRSGNVHNALSESDEMRSHINGNEDSALFAYGFRGLKEEPALEEQHFMTTFSFEMVAS